MLVETLPLPIEKQAVLEDASIIQESNRHPDVYYFISKGGKLYSPEGFELRKGIRIKTFIDKLEAELFDKLEKQSAGDEKTMIWVSPPALGIYDVTKVILYRVIKQQGFNLVENKAVVLDIDSKKALQLAQELAKASVNNPELKTLDDVRVTPIVFSPRQQVIDLLENLVPDPQWQMIRSGVDIELQKEAITKAKRVEQSRVSGGGEKIENYMGASSTSCPPGELSAYDKFLGHSGSSEGCQKIACRKCPWVASEGEVDKIKAGLLRSCPDCGWKP